MVVLISRRREIREALWFALVPVGVALVFGFLLAPRTAAPELVPLPTVDRDAVARIAEADRRLAELARSEPLPAPLRALGSALRDFHLLEARMADARALGDARRTIDAALIDGLPAGDEGLVRLRAVQLQQFLAELRRFRSTGEESHELQALAGGFVRAMTTEGWCSGHLLAPDEAVLAVMFKHMWDTFLGVEGRKAFDPSLAEERLLYAFYLSHAHPSKSMRDAIEAARRGAPDASSCRALAEAERGATESWRLERIARLAAIDPTYPAEYARGVATFRRGDYSAAAKSFGHWLQDHPDGPLALRARSYLRAAATDAQRTE
ncbi:MAG: hypothetical protein M3O50_20825 [Myxococcota bacterium]|nr:hypothetical protein [Myxococcota bacterium]